jgi:hypothetical protein
MRTKTGDNSLKQGGKALKKVLTVSFFFPPSQSNASMRVGKFARYLPEFGWSPIVLTVDKISDMQQTLPVEIDEAKVVRTRYRSIFRPMKQEVTGKGLHQAPIGSAIWRKGLRVLRYLARHLIRSPLMRIMSLNGIDWFPDGTKKGFRFSRTRNSM